MKIIEENIKIQLMCLKVKKSAQVMKTTQRWNVVMNYAENKKQTNVSVPEERGVWV